MAALKKAPQLRTSLPGRRRGDYVAFWAEIMGARNPQADQLEILKSGRAPRKQRSNTARGIHLVTLTFTAQHSIDQIVDRWAKAWNCSRSAVIRQALLHADRAWARELSAGRGPLRRRGDAR
jgi:hypothetical protein